MSGTEVIGRFAPTPSGFMHAGNLLCALVAYLSAKSKGGKFIIRIEDLDAMRCPKSAGMDILRTLSAVGIESDESVVWQSERTDAYKAAEAVLRARAEVYPCFCSRAELHAPDIPRLTDGGILYPQTCKKISNDERERKLAAGMPHALRIAVPDTEIGFIDGLCGEQAQNLAKECGDFILRRSDGVYAYQLAVVADDGESGVTEVVRGADLLFDTPRQIFLQRVLGLKTPIYTHIPLVTDSTGRKLSKSEGDSAKRLLESVRREEVIGGLAFAAGLLPENRPATLAELIPAFDMRNLNKKEIRLPENLCLQ